MDARLKLLTGSRYGELLSLAPGKLLVGREHNCDLRLEDPRVSRYHCLLLLDESGLKIRDLSKHNGTYVNGRRIEPGETVPLRDNDVVSVGSTDEETFTVELREGSPGRHGSGPDLPVSKDRAAIGAAVTLEASRTKIARGGASRPTGIVPQLAPVVAAARPDPADTDQPVDDSAADATRVGPRKPSAAADGRETDHVTLNVVAGPHAGAKSNFRSHDTFLIGSGPWSHLCLNQDSHFSRHHCRIEIRPPDCYLIDLGSHNGTFVNGNRVDSMFLRDGDMISGGKTTIRVGVGAARPTLFDAEGTRACVGQSIPGYALQEELGSGSMGMVYRAIHEASGQVVAIKVISQRQTRSEHAIQLFIREANLLGRLDHAHIVRSLDFGYTAGQLYLVMECIPTMSLQEVLAGASRSSSIRIPCAIVSQILRALDHAHRLSIVHRDIKPENILLFRKSGKLHAKLADFGLAKNYESAGLSQISQVGDIRGTIAYMAPELIADCRNARPTGDIYSLGGTLYYYLTHQLPFVFGNRNKLAVVLEDDPVPLETWVPDIPPALAKIVYRALAKDPSQRFSSAAEMLTALKPFAKPRRRKH